MSAFVDRIGQRFGRLVVTELAGVVNGRARWRCHCDCGRAIETLGQSLANGATQSCGCLKRESDRSRACKASTHGMSGTRTHGIWSGMLRRCRNPNDHAFANYGGRGIVVCDRWRTSFAAFLADMGEAPPGLEIDRIDVDGNYEPGNCRWATPQEQGNNKRTNRVVEHEGQLLTVAQYASATGLKYCTAYYRRVVRGGAPHRSEAMTRIASKAMGDVETAQRLVWGDE